MPVIKRCDKVVHYYDIMEYHFIRECLLANVFHPVLHQSSPDVILNFVVTSFVKDPYVLISTRHEQV